MSELLHDQLKAYEDRAAVVLAGLGNVTQRASGVSEEVPEGQDVGTPWIDVTIMRASSQERRGNSQKVLVETRVQVTVVSTSWPLATDMTTWVTSLADAYLGADAELAPLFAHVQSTDTAHLVSDAGHSPEAVDRHKILSEIQYRQPQGDIAGLITLLDAEDNEGGETRGHALATETASLVSFSTLRPQVAPYPPVAFYANAIIGDIIEVLDPDDIVVATASIIFAPAGQLALAALGAGVFTLRLNGQRAINSLTVTAAPQ